MTPVKVWGVCPHRQNNLDTTQHDIWIKAINANLENVLIKECPFNFINLSIFTDYLQYVAISILVLSE